MSAAKSRANRPARRTDGINKKLCSDLVSFLFANDLADVIALMRLHNLTTTFAARLDRPHRPEFRKLLWAILAD